MLLIAYKRMEATWSTQAGEWSSSIVEWEKLLNSQAPDEVFGVEAVFRKGGIEGIIIKHYQNIYGKRNFKILKRENTPPPADEFGKDY